MTVTYLAFDSGDCDSSTNLASFNGFIEIMLLRNVRKNKNSLAEQKYFISLTIWRAFRFF